MTFCDWMTRQITILDRHYSFIPVEEQEKKASSIRHVNDMSRHHVGREEDLGNKKGGLDGPLFVFY